MLAVFLDRTVDARRHEKPAEGETGIIPGNRGKADRNWCGPPLCGSNRARQISPVPLDGVAADPVMRHRNCAVRRETETASSRVRPRVSFEPCADAVTQRVTVATVQPGRSAMFRWDHPTKRPGRHGGARKERRAAGSRTSLAKLANLLLGAARKTRHPTASRKQPER